MNVFCVVRVLPHTYLSGGPDKFMGPAALLQSYRFLADSRDQGGEERLEF